METRNVSVVYAFWPQFFHDLCLFFRIVEGETWSLYCSANTKNENTNDYIQGALRTSSRSKVPKPRVTYVVITVRPTLTRKWLTVAPVISYSTKLLYILSKRALKSCRTLKLFSITSWSTAFKMEVTTTFAIRRILTLFLVLLNRMGRFGHRTTYN